MQSPNKARKVVIWGVMVACAMVLSYIERWLPVPGLPGVRLGLANIVVLLMLYTQGGKAVVGISLVRVLATGLFFTGIMSMAYSLAGGLLSCMGMWLLWRSKHIGIPMVSAIGGILHNIGQLLVAWLVLGPGVWGYLPLLLLSGAVTGYLNGIVAHPVIKYLGTMLREG